MDLAVKIQYFTTDVIGLIGWGTPFGMLKKDSDVNDYLKSIDEALPGLLMACALGLLPILQWPPLARLLAPSESDERGLGKLMGSLRCLVNKRLAKPTGRRTDMIAAFLRNGLDKDQIFTEAFLQLVAGSDTTATAIRCIMRWVVLHPCVYQKLQKEIDHTVAAGLVPDSAAIVPKAQAENLPYMNAVIRECMRIFPPVANLVPKVVPEGGDTIVIDGEHIFLPAGTNIGHNVLALCRNKAIFGNDVDEFRPERWIAGEKKDDGSDLDAMKRVTDIIFGYGKYQCLGKAIAWMEINKVIFEVRSQMLVTSYQLIYT
jgi:cytochrome P450